MRKRTKEWFVEQLDLQTHQMLQGLDELAVSASPDSLRAAEAFAALRAEVAEASQLRAVFLAQLALLDRAVNEAGSLEVARLLARDILRNAGLERVTDPGRTECFGAHDFDLAGGAVEIAQAAYVDKASGRLVQQGRLRPVRMEDTR